MAAEATSDAEQLNGKLIEHAVDIFNRRGKIAQSLNEGQMGWTASEAATIMKQVIDEVVFNEAGRQGLSSTTIMDRCPDLLAHALRLVGENTWKDASGIRTIDEAIEFEALGEQAALLVRALEERCTGL